MSAIEERPVTAASGKDTRVAGGVHPVPAMADQVLAQLRARGLVLPRGPRPGQPWAPRTDAESGLLFEARRLDRARQQLLAEVGRLRHLLGVRRGDGQERREGAARLAERWSGCPLGVTQLNVLVGAARGTHQHVQLGHAQRAAGPPLGQPGGPLPALLAVTAAYAAVTARSAGRGPPGWPSGGPAARWA
ncbi:hypothetical protein [Streptomyces scabiei]|uniref:hypothetical protein n=1 Tax=Streptomyces scabiei TaxID=1930 RepID=UPI0029B71D62|nr:hypothetical protein [Streptomyces scabiei]MDX2863193.1 hypothetical protein [Streptomyces scabiei]